jgi:hypothetical protein
MRVRLGVGMDESWFVWVRELIVSEEKGCSEFSTVQTVVWVCGVKIPVDFYSSPADDRQRDCTRSSRKIERWATTTEQNTTLAKTHAR